MGGVVPGSLPALPPMGWLAHSQRIPPALRVFVSGCPYYHKEQASGRTRVIAIDRCLHKCLHPFANGRLFTRAEKVGAIRLVCQLESISPRVNVLIRDNAVTKYINISLDLRLL